MGSPITTHVLDTAKGRPASGIEAVLEQHDSANDTWKKLGAGMTNQDGRITDLLPEAYPLQAGVFRLTFNVASYRQGEPDKGFYPFIPLVFEISDPAQHYHVPLLLNPYGYATYRGS